MSESRKRFVMEPSTPPAERRRMARVVHDERGQASVEWRAAPADQERPVLELLGEGGLALTKADVSYDPYARSAPLGSRTGKRTDLRRLSEWIKQMRELENRKRAAADTDEGES